MQHASLSKFSKNNYFYEYVELTNFKVASYNLV